MVSARSVSRHPQHVNPSGEGCEAHPFNYDSKIQLRTCSNQEPCISVDTASRYGTVECGRVHVRCSMQSRAHKTASKNEGRSEGAVQVPGGGRCASSHTSRNDHHQPP